MTPTTSSAVFLLISLSSTFANSFENDNHARILRRRWIPWTIGFPELPSPASWDYWTGVENMEQPRVVAVSAATEKTSDNEVDNGVRIQKL